MTSGGAVAKSATINLTVSHDQAQCRAWPPRTYQYDQGGNILEKRRHAYTTAANPHYMDLVKIIPYAYGDGNWKDKLTAYDGKAITYDAIGNPLKYGEPLSGNGWA